ncbi:MAG: homocysteine S-methyltransferase family protein [Syntrophales bacterium]|nr:homocysteine S-methyltransferase family protein [Syntrophales bacterium]
MNIKDKINKLLNKRVLILDGATGTELQKGGMPQGACPEIWCLENPRIIQAIHSDYQKSGADVVYTCTFGANRFKLGQYDVHNIREVNSRLAKLSKDAVGEKAMVAGDIGPTGQFVKPFGNIDFEEAVEVFKEQAVGLLEGGVDLFVIETMMDIQEARAALIAVKEVTDAFVMVTMTFEQDGRTLNGTDPVTALITLQSLGADAVGCNCSTGPEEMLEYIKAMKPYAKVPLVAKPNAGIPKLVGDETVFDMPPAGFASFGKKYVSTGVNIMGGCCGTSPEHIYAFRKEIQKEKPHAPFRKSISALSSARKFIVLEKDKPLCIVGERINPTGKKALQQELLDGKMSLIRQMTKEQKRDGAGILDVNVGVPGIDEVKTMHEVVSLLSTITDLPLVIDSSNIEAIETALRIYPGRALINSISGEEGKLKKLLPIAAKYGAMFILLPLTDREIPETAEKRKKIIKSVFKDAERFGFTRDDIVVDGLVMTVASDSMAAMETLKTIEWCSRKFKCKTIAGVTNVSFGMPQRKWINAAFLAMAQAFGLTLAIANPSNEELINVKIAADVLTQKDKDASSFISYFSETSHISKPDVEADKISPEQEVFQAILEGNREEIKRFIKKALSSGTTADSLVRDTMIPAIRETGDLFDKKEYFLPQLIASAEVMKRGLEYLDPYLKRDVSTQEAKAPVLLATVKGDIHDIGKNIVFLMLKNHGFNVIDLGKDVSSEKIIEEIKVYRPAIVGLSALMTTTMVNMKEVIDMARREGLKCKFIIGGAVVSKSYAQSIGAEYAKDGVGAVRLAQRLYAEFYDEKLKQGN